MNIEFKTIYLSENKGHGNARRQSIRNCSNELIAIMDADDISMPYRFEKQMNIMMSDRNISVVGGQIIEFIGNPENRVGKRQVFEEDAQIKRDMKKRCPMNQMTVMFRKSKLDMAGGYLDWYCNEDYYLWNRMFLSGCQFRNVSEVLVNVRVGELMSSRRGGTKYFFSEMRLQTYMLKNKIISLPRYVENIMIRFVGEVVLTNKLRSKMFRFVRKKITIEDIIEREIDVKSQKTQEVYSDFSVAMCVYGKDNAEWFDKAIQSVINQTVQPSEIVLVVDGSIPESIQNVIAKYERLCNKRETMRDFINGEDITGC